jgi:IstB-like ATP binding protein
VRLGRYPLIVVDEVGYIPFEPEAANLFFQLVSARYERASVIVTSNKPFGRWGEVFGDDVVAAAMIDRLVHHAEVIATAGTQSCSSASPSAWTHGRPGSTAVLRCVAAVAVAGRWRQKCLAMNTAMSSHACRHRWLSLWISRLIDTPSLPSRADRGRT